MERLLPPEVVPKIPDLKEYPSGFRPARLSPRELFNGPSKGFAPQISKIPALSLQHTQWPKIIYLIAMKYYWWHGSDKACNLDICGQDLCPPLGVYTDTWIKLQDQY